LIAKLFILQSSFFIFSIPMPYLLKTEPSEYSFADLQREKLTVWDGISNPVALKNLRAMKPGDQLIIYHTGDERRAVGSASVVSVDVSDPKNPAVKIKAGQPLSSSTSLADIKANSAFRDSPLVKQGRLSVVPLTDAQYRILTGA
jgi:predicted RNA-binding protein with PUA-like domain